jgi:hypothetical protein
MGWCRDDETRVLILSRNDLLDDVIRTRDGNAAVGGVLDGQAFDPPIAVETDSLLAAVRAVGFATEVENGSLAR